jgi:hypothetical protein
MWNVDCTDTLVWVCWYKIRLSASDRLKCDMCICLSGLGCMGILDFKCKSSNNLSKKSTTDLCNEYFTTQEVLFECKHGLACSNNTKV